MLKWILAALMIGIVWRALLQVRADPRFTRPVIIRHLVALAVLALYVAAGVWAVASWGLREGADNSRALLWTVGIVAYIAGGVTVLAIYLKRELQRAAGHRDSKPGSPV